ncbi:MULTISPECIES: GIY-YIG nuclease family protein [Nostoc]|uniref:GIY-YIG nuclease family protein n=1 Tax=Nostoc paludosum FACHB-159 TaxID=2692908 RepID=A0ABR8KG36_9NOSO|nr:MULTISPECIES: GIY-YIG nuclease family protein [Nostoc]MBD2682188.1 GIY-YIG nuclease family protein [Nostoc sp. FACHB-857]MBD2738516.1 GIY-YIG nuclease family protein [Nostoc paludosum FACHB-159]
MVCGIYQILNTVNGKSYIGQSRNIYRRWKQHTRGLDKPNVLEIGSYPLRYAFLKYELKQVVTTPGLTGLFDFKIIEECTEDKLLERERFWINKIDPEYNCNIWTPARKKKQIDSEPKFWVQYHNYNALGYLPAEYIIDEYLVEEIDYDEALTGIGTNKRSVLNTVGDTVFLIVGIGEKPKQYYLWSKFICEEINIQENENLLSYSAFGSGHLLDSPQLLNSKEFNEFKKYCGNFGFGFMRIKESGEGSIYLDTLKEIGEKHKPVQTKFNFSHYIKNFYTEVTRINPQELSAYHKRGFAQHLAISLHPQDAVLLLWQICTTLVIFEPSNKVLNYEGNTLLVHTLDYYNPESEKDFLISCGLDEETFPINAIQGWVIFEKIFKYDEQSFAADKDLHLLGESLAKYQSDCGYEGYNAWGITVKEPLIFDVPIVNVFAPEDIYSEEFWEPETGVDLEDFLLALERPFKSE